MSQKSLPLERLIYEACKHLESLSYSSNTRRFHRKVWQGLLSWSQEHGIQTITPETPVRYLAYLGISPGSTSVPLSSNQRYIRTSIWMLEEFALCGHWKLRHRVIQKPSFPPGFETTVEDFIRHRRVIDGVSPSQLWHTRHNLLRFALFLESRHIEKWTDIQPENVPAFFASLTQMQPSSLPSIASIIRKFLKYLWLQQLHPQDLSIYLPQLRRRYQRIPAVWRQEEVDALLAAVDRASTLGKRDYAILLLAARLGLRTGEIRALKLEHIQWDKSQLEIFQSKTGNMLVLPLSEEVGGALIDYLRYGRPPVTCREVFVRHIAPFQPFAQSSALYSILTAYRRRAHIRMDVSRGRGLHSLRHTLATNLLEQEVPTETIAAVLGHKSLESTMIYTKVNLKLLRSAALDPEEVCHV